MSGKGSRPRPLAVKYDEFASNWDNIFRKKDKPKPQEPDKKQEQPKSTNPS